LKDFFQAITLRKYSFLPPWRNMVFLFFRNSSEIGLLYTFYESMSYMLGTINSNIEIFQKEIK
jgi:hypothetical protein